MAIKKKVTISWSGGKDSALALFKILQTGEFEITGLHTVINEETKRVGMHGVREELIEAQATSLGLPLTKIYLESSENHSAYKKLTQEFYQQCAAEGIEGVVFGDIFLEDLRQFRESLLRTDRLLGIYPLWQIPTDILINQFIDAGFKTLICSADAKYFSSHQAGKTIDKEFVTSLSSDVDPCGENGEFHTFVYDGPIFNKPIAFRTGEVVKKTYSFQKKNDDGSLQKIESAFWFQDLVPLIT